MILTEEQADQIVEQTRADFRPGATALTYDYFCSNCPRKREGCFPCRTAQTMIPIYLSVLMQVLARFN